MRNRQIYTPTIRRMVTDYYQDRHPDSVAVSLDVALEYAYDHSNMFNFPSLEVYTRTGEGEEQVVTKKHLVLKTMKYYADYSISYPTVEQWQDNMDSSFAVVMPYYNYLYDQWWNELYGGTQGDRLDFRNFRDYEVHHEGSTQNTASGTDTTTGNGTDTTVNAQYDYPDIGADGAGALELSTRDNKYATAKTAGKNTDERSDSTTYGRKDNGEDEWEEYRIGASGRSPWYIKMEAKKAFDNIEADIISDVEIRKNFYFDYNEMGLYL